MSQKFIRIYRYLDINDIKNHLLIWGDLSAQCLKCNSLGLKLDLTCCPHCQTEFKYVSFRNVRDHLPKLQRISQERPGVIFVDYDDYRKLSGALKAEEFLK